MRLIELEPEFVTYDGAKITRRSEAFDVAQGIWFLCPLCFEKNKGPVGTHMVEVSFTGPGCSAGTGLAWEGR